MYVQFLSMTNIDFREFVSCLNIIVRSYTYCDENTVKAKRGEIRCYFVRLNMCCIKNAFIRILLAAF